MPETEGWPVNRRELLQAGLLAPLVPLVPSCLVAPISGYVYRGTVSGRWTMPLLYPQTAAEREAGTWPWFPEYPPGDSRRYEG